MARLIQRILIAVTVGSLVAIFIGILRLFYRIRVYGFKTSKFNSEGRGVLVVANHPSMVEAVVIPALMVPACFVNWRLIPTSTPDAKNFYRKWWFALVRAICIEVDRDGGKEKGTALRAMIRALHNDELLVLFAEGGRTDYGTEYCFSPRKNKRMRQLKTGCGMLGSEVRPVIVPVWSEGGETILPNTVLTGSKLKFIFPKLWNSMYVRVGEPFVPPENATPEEVRLMIQNKLLEIADRN